MAGYMSRLDDDDEIEEKRHGAFARFGIGVARGIGDRHMGTYASSTTFYYFLSLIPLLIFISALLPKTGVNEEDLIAAATAVTPDILDNLVWVIISEAYSHAGGLVPFSILVLLWTSIQGNMALLQGMNDVYQVREKRSYPQLIVLALIWTAVLLLIFIVMVYFVFGSKLQSLIRSLVSDNQYQAIALTRTRVIICVLIAAALFALFYTLMPAGRRNYLFQIPGAVFAAVVWLIFSYFFSLYVNGSNKYTMFYGSLAMLAILLFWMYCCFYILLIGGFINCHFDRSIQKLFRRMRYDRYKRELARREKREKKTGNGAK